METLKINNFEIRNMSIKEFNDLRNAGKINSDTAYQRGLTAKWLTPSYRGTWLDSIMQGNSIGAVMVNLTNDGTYELIDGKQRSNAIALTLDNLGTFEGMEDDTLNRTFSSWTAENRQAFLDYVLTLIVYQGLDEAECRSIFERTNGGVQLGAFELRRGKLVKILTQPAFIAMVNDVHALMLKASAKNTRSNAEEVLLQALSNIAYDNCDFTAKRYVEILEALPVESYSKNFEVLRSAVNNVIELCEDDTEEQENFSTVKWILKKSVLNCLLTLGVKEFNFLNFGSFLKSKTDKSAGADQVEFKKYNSNATASEVNVKGRIAILNKIQDGTFTKNVAGEAKQAKVIQPKTQKIELTPLPVDKKLRLQASVIWDTDDEDYINASVGMALAWCKQFGFKYEKPFQTSQSKKNQFSYLDVETQKTHYKNIDDLSSTVTVKIEAPTAEAVTTEA